MTFSEVIDEYKKLFILVIETAGEETGNKTYLNVESILSKPQYTSQIKKLIDTNTPFRFLVATLISCLILEMYGIEALINEYTEEEYNNFINSIWDLYLKKPTENFTSKYGLTKVGDVLDVRFKIIEL